MPVRPFAVLLSIALALQSFPAWAQVVELSEPLLAPQAPLSAQPPVEAALPTPPSEGLALSGEALTTEPLASLSRDGASVERRASASRSLRPAAALVSRPESRERPLSARVFEHAERKGFALRAPAAAVEIDEGSPLPGVERAPSHAPLRAAPEVQGRGPRARPEASPEWRFLAGMFFVDVGVEALSVAVPQLADSLSGHFLSASSVSTAAFAALTLGTLLAGPLVDKLGFRKVYFGLGAARAAGSAALALLYFKGALGLPALTALFGLDFLLQGVSRVAEGVLPTLLHGSKHAEVNRFGTRFELMIEACGIAFPALAGAVIAAKGFGPVLAAYPLLMLASSAAVLFQRLPARKEPLAFLGSAVWEKGRIREVAKALREQANLRRAAVAYGLQISMTNFVYFSIAPAFGLFVAGSPLAAAKVSAELISSFALGGLLGSGTLWALDRWGRPRDFFRTTSKWLVVGAAACLGGALFPLASSLGPWLGYAAILPFGAATAGMFIQLETLVKSEAPAAIRGSVLSIVRAAAMLFATLGFLALGGLFEFFSKAGPVRIPTPGAFVAVALLLVPAALVFLWAARGIRSSRREPR